MGGPTRGDAGDGSECSNDDVCWAGKEGGGVIPDYSPQWRELIG